MAYLSALDAGDGIDAGPEAVRRELARSRAIRALQVPFVTVPAIKTILLMHI